MLIKELSSFKSARESQEIKSLGMFYSASRGGTIASFQEI